MEKDCYFPRKIVPIVFLALFSYFNGGGAKYDVRLLSALGLIFGAIGDYLIGKLLVESKISKDDDIEAQSDKYDCFMVSRVFFVIFQESLLKASYLQLYRSASVTYFTW